MFAPRAPFSVNAPLRAQWPNEERPKNSARIDQEQADALQRSKWLEDSVNLHWKKDWLDVVYEIWKRIWEQGEAWYKTVTGKEAILAQQIFKMSLETIRYIKNKLKPWRKDYSVQG